MDAAQVIRDLQEAVLTVSVVGTVGVLILAWNWCPDRSAHAPRRSSSKVEICKLHQRPISDCTDMHEPQS